MVGSVKKKQILKYSKCFERVFFSTAAVPVFGEQKGKYILYSIKMKTENGRIFFISNQEFLNGLFFFIFFRVCKFILSNQIIQKLIVERKYDQRFSPFVCVGVSIQAI